LAPIAERAGHIRTVFVRGSSLDGLPVPDLRPWSALAARDAPGPRAVVAGADAAMLLFTSGSTGRSKACVLSHRYVVRQAEIFAEQLGLTGDDILFCPFPLFHADAAIFTVAPRSCWARPPRWPAASRSAGSGIKSASMVRRSSTSWARRWRCSAISRPH